MIYKQKKTGFMIDSDKKIPALEKSKNWRIVGTIEAVKNKIKGTKVSQTKKKAVKSKKKK